MNTILRTAQPHPSEDLYGFLNDAYDFFNRHLFGGRLPKCMLTLQRQPKMMGYTSSKRWQNLRGDVADELAINPDYFKGHSTLEVFQTLVHEQCHIWQYHFGKPSRRGYHNREWADLMESIGLIPSSTGQPGGHKTGERMADYVQKPGQFLQASIELIAKKNELPWYDCWKGGHQAHLSTIFSEDGKRQSSGIDVEMALIKPIGEIPLSGATGVSEFEAANDQDTEIQLAAARKQTRLKYQCPSCANSVWGKPELRIMCTDCKEMYSIT
jgi:predicted SprT family Zn-dependent metalloprotease